ncbi:hypothetical protein TanjilG_29641 [Lupinus angustifolius]|uniref:Uncharacterized protein n=1 Tax=Lupinus angustifolius TaxID=3871 RepID=A0A4P1R6V9_LUPAN|nr:hypothetical protein TanjilG_29641 [Lupinus angustifolius]
MASKSWKEKSAKKPLVSLALKGKRWKSTLLGECSFKPSSSKIGYHPPPPPCFNPDDTKKVLSNWKQMRISKQRREAKVKLDLIKNTTGFTDNMDSMRDFEKLIGCKFVSHTISREEFFGGYLN